MLYQTLMKSVRFLCSHRQVSSHARYASVYYSKIFQHFYKSQFISSANFGTSSNFCSDENPSPVENEDDMYYFEGARRLAKHVDDPNMPEVKITFVSHDGKEFNTTARVGMTVVEVALHNKVPIDAACETKKACTTCHCYVDENLRDYFTPPDLEEEDLLDIAPFCKPTSRLSCQMKIIKKFDHIRIQLPQATKNFHVDKSAGDKT